MGMEELGMGTIFQNEFEAKVEEFFNGVTDKATIGAMRFTRETPPTIDEGNMASYAAAFIAITRELVLG